MPESLLWGRRGGGGREKKSLTWVPGRIPPSVLGTESGRFRPPLGVRRSLWPASRSRGCEAAKPPPGVGANSKGSAERRRGEPFGGRALPRGEGGVFGRGCLPWKGSRGGVPSPEGCSKARSKGVILTLAEKTSRVPPVGVRRREWVEQATRGSVRRPARVGREERASLGHGEKHPGGV